MSKSLEKVQNAISFSSKISAFIKKFLDFFKEKYAKEFCDKALKLISGYSKFVRGVKKTQKAVKETNEALDIDICEIAKNGVGFVCDVALTAGSSTTAKGGMKITTAIAKVISRKNAKKENQSLIEARSEQNEFSEK